MKINLIKKLLIVVSFLLCVSLNQYQLKASQLIEYCAIENPMTVATDFQLDDLDTVIECFLEDGSYVDVSVEWSLMGVSLEEFNNNVGRYDVIGTLTSDSIYSLSNPLEIQIIKEGYSILDGTTMASGSDLNSLLVNATSEYVKITNAMGLLSADMFVGSAKILDLSELDFVSLGANWFKNMPNLSKLVLPTTVHQFQGTASLKEIEIVVTNDNSMIDYFGDSTIEKAFFTALSFNTLDQLEMLGLNGYMSNELDSSLVINETYSSNDIQLTYDYIEGLSLTGLNQNEITLHQRVLFNQSLPSHPKEGIIRYYGADKSTYLEQGISYKANYQGIDEGIQATYTLTNQSTSPVSNIYFRQEGFLSSNLSATNNSQQLRISNLDKQLIIESNTRVNRIEIIENDSIKSDKPSNTHVKGLNDEFLMEWEVSSLPPNQTTSIVVVYKIETITQTTNSDTSYYPTTYTGWIIKDKEDKLVEKIKHFKKQYDGNYNVYYSEKDILCTGWKLIDNEWYFFREDGTCLMKGWLKNLEDWYYFENYSCVTNQWIATTNGRWYYQDQQGRMVRNQIIDGYSVNGHGIYWGIESKKAFIILYIPNY